MKGLFITFEGTEGSGKTTQIAALAERLRSLGHTVRTLREPGGTPIGEEIRHTLQHSAANRAMTPEAELLLLNASRAQLVREVIRPALAAGEIVLCDRFYDSTLAYQAYGRGLDSKQVQRIISFAVGRTRPDLTLLLMVPIAVSEARRRARPAERDRMEEADRAFFERVEKGYEAIAAAQPRRIRRLDATLAAEVVAGEIWAEVEPHLQRSFSGSLGNVEQVAVEHLEEIEYQAVLQTLRKQDFNRTHAAKALGISRRALIYKLQRMRERGFDVDRAASV
jgi:dTMP kinase